MEGAFDFGVFLQARYTCEPSADLNVMRQFSEERYREEAL